MKTGTAVLLLSAAALALAQTGPVHNLASNIKQYTAQEDAQILKEFEGLRNSDVVDGLDAVGVMDQTWMDPEIKPMWRDEVNFKHRMYGVARTVRLVPPQTRAPGSALLTVEQYAKWTAELQKMGGDPIYGLARRGGPGPAKPAAAKPPAPSRTNTVLVVDSRGTRDNGYCGSNNAEAWMLAGMRGLVTETGCRDSDEDIKQRIPIYQRFSTRGVNQGRMLVESTNDVVVVGGVTVYPGDIIVGDSDGVVVVPREKALAVARAAQKVQEGDKAGRRKMYEQMGLPQDFSTLPRKQ